MLVYLLSSSYPIDGTELKLKLDKSIFHLTSRSVLEQDHVITSKSIEMIKENEAGLPEDSVMVLWDVITNQAEFALLEQAGVKVSCVVVLEKKEEYPDAVVAEHVAVEHKPNEKKDTKAGEQKVEVKFEANKFVPENRDDIGLVHLHFDDSFCSKLQEITGRIRDFIKAQVNVCQIPTVDQIELKNTELNPLSISNIYSVLNFIPEECLSVSMIFAIMLEQVSCENEDLFSFLPEVTPNDEANLFVSSGDTVAIRHSYFQRFQSILPSTYDRAVYDRIWHWARIAENKVLELIDLPRCNPDNEINGIQTADRTAQLALTKMNPSLYTRSLLVADIELLLDKISGKTNGNWNIGSRTNIQYLTDNEMRLSLLNRPGLVSSTDFSENHVLIAMYRPTPLSRELSKQWNYSIPSLLPLNSFLNSDRAIDSYNYSFGSNMSSTSRILYPSDRSVITTELISELSVALHLDDTVASLNPGHLYVSCADGTSVLASPNSLSYTLLSGVSCIARKESIEFVQTSLNRTGNSKENSRVIFTNGFVAINSQSARIYYSPLGSIFNSNGKEIDSLGATVICPKSLAWVTTYADKRIKIVYPDGSMFTQFPDGTRIFQDVIIGGWKRPTSLSSRENVVPWKLDDTPRFINTRIMCPGLPLVIIRQPDLDADISPKPELSKRLCLTAYFDINSVEGCGYNPSIFTYRSLLVNENTLSLDISDGTFVTRPGFTVFYPARLPKPTEETLLSDSHVAIAGSYEFYIGTASETKLVTDDMESNHFVAGVDGTSEVKLARDSYNSLPDGPPDYIPPIYYSPAEDILPPRIFVREKSGTSFEMLAEPIDSLDFLAKKNNELYKINIQKHEFPHFNTFEIYAPLLRPIAYSGNFEPVTGFETFLGDPTISGGLGAPLEVNLSRHYAFLLQKYHRSFSEYRVLVRYPEITKELQAEAVKNRMDYFLWKEAQISKDEFYSVVDTRSEDQLKVEHQLALELLEQRRVAANASPQKRPNSKESTGKIYVPFGKDSIPQFPVEKPLHADAKDKLKLNSSSQLQDSVKLDKVFDNRNLVRDLVYSTLFSNEILHKNKSIMSGNRLSSAFATFTKNEQHSIDEMLKLCSQLLDILCVKNIRRVDLKVKPCMHFKELLNAMGFNDSGVLCSHDVEFQQYLFVVQAEYDRVYSWKQGDDLDSDPEIEHNNAADCDSEGEFTVQKAETTAKSTSAANPPHKNVLTHRPYIALTPLMKEKTAATKKSLLKQQLEDFHSNTLKSSLSATDDFDDNLLSQPVYFDPVIQCGSPNIKYLSSEAESVKHRVKMSSTQLLEARWAETQNQTIGAGEVINPALQMTFPEFRISPNSIDFGDLTFGCTYRSSFTLTNHGYDTGRFQILPCESELPVKVYYRPGPISAGMVLRLEVEIFTGNMGPFNSEIFIVTERSKFSLPFRGSVSEGDASLKVISRFEKPAKIGETRLISIGPSQFAKSKLLKTGTYTGTLNKMYHESHEENLDREQEEATLERELANEILKSTDEPKIPQSVKHFVDSSINMKEFKAKVAGKSNH